MIHKYAQPFEKNYWLLYKAYRNLGYDVRGSAVIINNKSFDKTEDLEFHSDFYIQQEVNRLKEEWKYKNDHSTVKGHLFHHYAENILANKEPDLRIPDIRGQYGLQDISEVIPILQKQFLTFRDKFKWLVPVASEVVISDFDLGIAGTFDQLFYNEEEDCFDLFDWKTNKEIKTENKFQSMKPPLSSHHDCNFIHYTIQLNLYKTILEKYTNIRIGNMTIVHFYENNDSYKVYDIPNIQDDVQALLEDYSQTI